MTETPFRPARRGLYPTVLLGDAQWDRIVKALRDRGTKQDAALADRIEQSVQRQRQRNWIET